MQIETELNISDHCFFLRDNAVYTGHVKRIKIDCCINRVNPMDGVEITYAIEQSVNTNIVGDIPECRVGKTKEALLKKL